MYFFYHFIYIFLQLYQLEKIILDYFEHFKYFQAFQKRRNCREMNNSVCEGAVIVIRRKNIEQNKTAIIAKHQRRFEKGTNIYRGVS